MHREKSAASFAVWIGDPRQAFFGQIAAASAVGESNGEIGECRHSMSPYSARSPDMAADLRERSIVRQAARDAGWPLARRFPPHRIVIFHNEINKTTAAT